MGELSAQGDHGPIGEEQDEQVSGRGDVAEKIHHADDGDPHRNDPNEQDGHERNAHTVQARKRPAARRHPG